MSSEFFNKVIQNQSDLGKLPSIRRYVAQACGKVALDRIVTSYDFTYVHMIFGI